MMSNNMGSGAQLAIRLLGDLSLSINGKPKRLSLKKGGALLAYLAVESDRAHSREKLAALLWPDQDPSAGMRNLRQVIHKLRKELSGDGLAEILVSDNLTIQLNPAAGFWIDVEQFIRLADSGQMAQAVELYRGDFLAGFMADASLPDESGYLEWLVAVEQMLRGRMHGMLDRLFQSSFASGCHDEAQHWLERRLHLDPWDEPTHRQLMALHLAAGRRHAALTQFEHCRKLLSAGLGLQPSPETLELVQQARVANGAPQGEAGLSPLQTHKFNYLFNIVDRDGDGWVHEVDVTAVTEGLCREFNLAQESPSGQLFVGTVMGWWKGMAPFASARDGVGLNQSDWLRFWSAWYQQLSDEALSLTSDEIKSKRQAAASCYALLDRDGDGFLTLEDYASWVRAWSTAIDSESSFRQLDRDGDGRLSVAEFIQAASDFHLSGDPESPGNFFFGNPFTNSSTVPVRHNGANAVREREALGTDAG